MTEKTTGETRANQTLDQNKSVNLQRVYIKDVSFEAPRSPQIFKSDWKPQLNLNIQHQFQVLSQDLEENQLKIAISAKIDKKIAFSIDIIQAGIFKLQHLNDTEKDYVRQVICPGVLFPYAREAIDNLLVKASMPPIMLAQINFETVFRHRKSSDRKESSAQIEIKEGSRKIN